MEYLIRPTNDDLMHKSHKYIDKKMGKNGKWIYIYKRTSGVYAKNSMERYKKAVSKATQNKQSAEKRLDSINKEYDREVKRFNEGVSSGKYFDKDNPNFQEEYLDYLDKKYQPQVSKANQKWEQSKRDELKAQTDYKVSYDKYMKTPIGKIESASESIKKAYNSGLDWLYKKLKIN